MAYDCPSCGEEDAVTKVNDPFKNHVWECAECGPIDSKRMNVT
jgi:uncharacterized Zn finger protein